MLAPALRRLSCLLLRRRKDQAREADKLEKYLSCLILAPITLGLAFALFALHHYVRTCLQLQLHPVSCGKYTVKMRTACSALQAILPL